MGTQSPIYFCRVTQTGLLRMLTNRGAMGSEVLTQAQAWTVFDEFLRNPNIEFLEEPSEINILFRRHTSRHEVSTQQWADGYLQAFAEGHGLRLVTFDKTFAGRVKGSVLLQA